MTAPTGSTGSDRTLVERLLGGDWRPAVAVAVPTVVVAYTLAMLSSAYLFWTGDADVGAHSKAGYFRAAGSLAAMALGSPLFVHGSEGAGNGEDFEFTGSFYGGMAPLTISLLVLLTFGLLLRTHLPAGSTRTQATTAVRAALLGAIGSAALGFTAYAGNALGQADVSASPGRIFGWSLLWFLVVGGLVTLRPGRQLADRSESDPRISRLVDGWWLPAQGAVAAMAAAVVLGGVAGIVVMFIEAGDQPLDVVEALPLVFAYFVNLGVDVFQFAMGAPLHAGIGGVEGGDSSVWLFDRHGIPAGYVALVILPPLAVAAGVLRMRKYRDLVDPSYLARSCYRMALPALLLYLALAIPGRAGFGAGGAGPGASGHAGPSILLGSVILVAWFALLCYAAGRWLLRGPVAAQSPPPGARPQVTRRRRWVRLQSVPVTLGALAILLATAGGGVATASEQTDESGDIGAASGLFIFLFFATASMDEVQSDVSTDLQPVPSVSPFSDGDIQSSLQQVGAAEDRYFAEHGTYTTNELELDVPVPMSVFIVEGDSQRFCVQGYGDTGQDYALSSDMGGLVTPGSC